MGLLSFADPILFTNDADPPLDRNFAVQIDAIWKVQMWHAISGLKLDLTPHSAANAPAGHHGRRNSAHGGGINPSASSQEGTLILKRCLGPASADIYKWCMKYKTTGVGNSSSQMGTNAIVLLYDVTSSMSYEWELTGVTPLKWDIGAFQVASAGKPVEETLTVKYADMKFSIGQIAIGG